MRFVCPREELSRGLQAVLRSVGARAGIPALSGVLMELTNNDLALTTTDLELTTRVTVAISGEPGQVVVPARLLSEVVRSLPTEEVEVRQDNGTIRVSGGRAKFGLRSLPAEDFPKAQEPSDKGIELSLEGETFRKALNQAVVGASRDETRPVLTGVLFEGEGDELRLVATDSYRLAVRRLVVDGADGLRLLVPARAVQELVRTTASDPVKVRTEGAQVAFTTGSLMLRSRLIEGEFPDYKRLLPGPLPNHLEADRTTLSESLRRVAVVAQDATPVFLELDGEESRITCQSQGLGDANEVIDADYKGDAMRVAFNPAYLLQGLEAIEDERVRIELSDSQRPVIIRGASADQYTYLLMPVRVS